MKHLFARLQSPELSQFPIDTLKNVLCVKSASLLLLEVHLKSHQHSEQHQRFSAQIFSRSSSLPVPSASLVFFSSDGLVDCMDPDCCAQISCQGQTYCRGSADPAAVAGQGQSAAAGAAATQPFSKSFYDRVSFLIGPSGSHLIPGDNPFNSR